MQSRRHSLLEAVINTASGFIISLVVTEFLFPVFDLHPSFAANFSITTIFTIISVIRSYICRRIFNHLHTKGVL